MNLRWLLGDFTDPQYELSLREQHRLSMAAHKKYVSWYRFWGYSLVVIGVRSASPINTAYPRCWVGLDGRPNICARLGDSGRRSPRVALQRVGVSNAVYQAGSPGDARSWIRSVHRLRI